MKHLHRMDPDVAGRVEIEELVTTERGDGRVHHRIKSVYKCIGFQTIGGRAVSIVVPVSERIVKRSTWQTNRDKRKGEDRGVAQAADVLR